MFDLLPMSEFLWILEGACVGQASRLTSNDIRSQASSLEPPPYKARSLHYLPDVQNGTDFGISVCYYD
jgi:hypothetical protein